jgi:hypothetical protein
VSNLHPLQSTGDVNDPIFWEHAPTKAPSPLPRSYPESSRKASLRQLHRILCSLFTSASGPRTQKKEAAPRGGFPFSQIPGCGLEEDHATNLEQIQTIDARTEMIALGHNLVVVDKAT